MVIIDRYKTIFIRIPKNASTSLATFFVKNCGETTDIWTSIGDSKIKTNNVPQKIIDENREQYRFIHLTLQEIINYGLLSKEKALEMRPIGVIRNPLERQLSLYFFKYKNRGTNPDHFRSLMPDGFIETDKSNSIRQYEYLTIDGEHHGKWWLYEDIDARLAQYVQNHQINIKYHMPNFKSNIKPKGDLLTEYYDRDTIIRVSEYFAKDIEIYEKIKNENR